MENERELECYFNRSVTSVIEQNMFFIKHVLFDAHHNRATSFRGFQGCERHERLEGVVR